MSDPWLILPAIAFGLPLAAVIAWRAARRRRTIRRRLGLDRPRHLEAWGCAPDVPPQAVQDWWNRGGSGFRRPR